MPDSKLAVVTGASTGIGLELARECAKHKFDLVVAANEPEIVSAADDLRREGAKVEAVRADLATLDGVDELYAKLNGRRVDALPRQCRTRIGKGLPRSGLRRHSLRPRYQHYGHDLSHSQSRQ
jgi:NAD(P)-dependent dehydrogenase (short-subunit alcohol dehydrogenase family)